MLDRKTGEMQRLAAKAEAMSPLAVLSRGYSLVTKGEHQIGSVNDVKLHDEIQIRFSDGAVSAEVTAKKQ
jgi:exodeoxyribonuclease VII large subunit